MARKKKKKADTSQPDIPNRYGAQGIVNDSGDPCCCHVVPLDQTCDGCIALRKTKRQPTLVGVGDTVWHAAPDERVRDEHRITNGPDTEPPEGE